MPFEARSGISECAAARVAVRLGISFSLQHIQIIRDQRQLIDGLVLLALFQANYGRLKGDQIQALMADNSKFGPIPVSVNAIAQSLKLPFETVRKRVLVLKDDGLCELQNSALVMTPAHLSTPQFQWQMHAVWGRTRSLCLDLTELGMLRKNITQTQCFRLPVYDAVRLATEFTLRHVEGLIANFESPAFGIMMLHILRANTEHLDNTYTEVAFETDVIPDDYRRPVPVPALASRCGLTVETTRRHVAYLLEQGWVQREQTGGVLIGREALENPHWQSARRQNLLNLHRLTDGLEYVVKSSFED